MAKCQSTKAHNEQYLHSFCLCSLENKKVNTKMGKGTTNPSPTYLAASGRGASSNNPSTEPRSQDYVEIQGDIDEASGHFYAAQSRDNKMTGAVTVDQIEAATKKRLDDQAAAAAAAAAAAQKAPPAPPAPAATSRAAADPLSLAASGYSGVACVSVWSR